MRIRWLLAPSLPLLLSTGALAQVPDGWFVSANFQWTNFDPIFNPAPPPGGGGLFLVHPAAPGAAIAVAGLPSAITGAGVPGPRGASTVVYRSSDGALIVGDSGPAGTTISLHVVTLTGSVATGITTIPLGTSAPGSLPLAQVGQADLLPNGDVVVAVTGLGPPGPLAGQILGIVSTASGGVTPVPVTPVPPGIMNALAVDASGPGAAIAYFGMFQSPIGSESTIYSVPLPGGGAPTTVLTFGPTPVIGLTNLALDCSGQLRMTAFNGPPNLFTVDPVTATSAPLSPPLGYLNAVAVETATGDLALATFTPSPYPFSLVRRTSAGGAVLLASAPPGGWGVPAGLAVNPDPEPYGPATRGTFTYAWSLCPNPGGLPTAGNAGFSLTVATNGPSAAGVVAAGLGSASLPNFLGLGFTLLVDPAQVLFVGSHGGTIPLPIPNDPTLVGARVFFQSFHVDGGASAGIAATEGVEVTIL
ncbi:MAG TPA: hypothetical protein VFI25_12785 [Planctomycetota bacterium]|jgi:hypothetical protein|nr:hypothetical protein [Planctomycetota bacterium]